MRNCSAVLNSYLILRATKFVSLRECSHNRTTRQPPRLRKRVVARSRWELRRILFFQYFRFSCGIRQCRRHPCQKQPSTNIASLYFGKTKSGFPTPRCCLRQPLIPCSRRIKINFNSVALLPFDRTAAMTADRCCFENMSAIRSLSLLCRDRRHLQKSPPGENLRVRPGSFKGVFRHSPFPFPIGGKRLLTFAQIHLQCFSPLRIVHRTELTCTCVPITSNTGICKSRGF